MAVIATGIAAFVLTVLTDHELGVIKVLPYWFHVAVDRVVGLTFVVAPFVLGFGGLDAVYYCAHHPSVGEPPYRFDCDCRKPKPGMILAAARDHAIDLPSSIVIGDRWRDIEMGLAAGTKAMLVETGYGRTEAARRPPAIPPVPVFGTLIEAVSVVLRGA